VTGSAPLVAVAHGSRDPRSAATVRALGEAVRRQAPGLDVRVAFLDLSEPLVTDVLRGLYAEGHREVVVVPLLLGSAYHARVDLPALIDGVRRDCPRLEVSTSDVLGPDPVLTDVALDRLAGAGADLGDPGLGVVLSAVGSSSAEANAAVARLARRWRKRLPVASVVPAFASATKPDVPAAIAELRARGARRIAVASWFLAPGLLPDRIARLAREAAPECVIAGVLADEPRLAELVVRRYSDSFAILENSA
jgi:sirohydrochlorin ferrochelatase